MQPLWIKLGDFDFAAARSAAAHGDDFTAIFRSSHEQNATIVSSFELKEGGTRPYSLRSFIVYSLYIVYSIVIDRNRARFQTAPSPNARGVGGFALVAPQRMEDGTLGVGV